DNKLLLILVDICIGAVRIENNLGNSLVRLNDTLDSSPLQLAVLICDQHRIRSTFLDLNFVRVARSTVASNCDKITALDSNARVVIILDVRRDSSVGLPLIDYTTAVQDGLYSPTRRSSDLDNKLLLILVDICIGAV